MEDGALPSFRILYLKTIPGESPMVLEWRGDLHYTRLIQVILAAICKTNSKTLFYYYELLLFSDFYLKERKIQICTK